VILLLDLKRVSERRFLSYDAAMIDADESKRRVLASVGRALIFEHERHRDKGRSRCPFKNAMTEAFSRRQHSP
jgi:hypothetical protein